MGISSYPNGFPGGLSVRGMPVDMVHPGKVFYVNNSSVLAVSGIAGSDNNPGTQRKPFKTLSFAVSMCVAGRGDIIMLAPGHAETFSSSTAITINQSGIAIMGLGSGNLRPTFTLGTATSTTINVTAAGVSFINCIFVANFAAVASCFTLTTAKDFAISMCEFRDTSSSLNFVALVSTDTTSDDADGLTLESNKILTLNASAAFSMVLMKGTNDRVYISGNSLTNPSVSTTGGMAMQIATGKLVTHLLMQSNVFNLTQATGLTAGVLITTNGSTNTGVLSGNFVQGLDDTTPILVTASSGLRYFNNYYAGTSDASGFLVPAAGT